MWVSHDDNTSAPLGEYLKPSTPLARWLARCKKLEKVSLQLSERERIWFHPIMCSSLSGALNLVILTRFAMLYVNDKVSMLVQGRSLNFILPSTYTSSQSTVKGMKRWLLWSFLKPPEALNKFSSVPMTSLPSTITKEVLQKLSQLSTKWVMYNPKKKSASNCKQIWCRWHHVYYKESR